MSPLRLVFVRFDSPFVGKIIYVETAIIPFEEPPTPDAVRWFFALGSTLRPDGIPK